MSEVTYDQGTEVSNAVATEWLDSKGSPIEEGDSVYVSVELAQTKFDYAAMTVVPGRDFDFGEVGSLNEDGTVSVFWNSAGCSCNDPDGRTENPSDLSVSLDNEFEDIAVISERTGYEKGQQNAQNALREALGLADNTQELTAVRERLAALEAKNN